MKQLKQFDKKKLLPPKKEVIKQEDMDIDKLQGMINQVHENNVPPPAPPGKERVLRLTLDLKEDVHFAVKKHLFESRGRLTLKAYIENLIKADLKIQ